MNLSRFKKCLGKWKLENAKHYTEHGLRWRWYHDLASLTRYINYDCQFDEFSCKKWRRENKRRWRGKQPFAKAIKMYDSKHYEFRYTGFMCCCSGCRDSRGWLSQIPKCDDTLRKMARYFNNFTGYWRWGKGCILPRKYRSSTCLGYHCNYDRSSRRLTKYELFLMDALRMHPDEILNRWEKLTGRRLEHVAYVIGALERKLKQRRTD